MNQPTSTFLLPLREVEAVQRETSSQLQHQLTSVVEATRQAGGLRSYNEFLQVHMWLLREFTSECILRLS